MVGLLGCTAACVVGAQQAQKPPYRTQTLPPSSVRPTWCSRMTLEEKASQLVNQARAIPRLGVPAYDWWSEALHGVAVDGTTEFPEPIGLGATFDAPGIHTMATAIGTEGRVKHEKARQGRRLEHLRWPRFLGARTSTSSAIRAGAAARKPTAKTRSSPARMGVAFVTGMQGNDPKYYRVIATPKHFAVHSGPEPTRHFADVDVSKHDMNSTPTCPPSAPPLPKAKPAPSCAPTTPSTASRPAPTSSCCSDQLRGKWGFKGYVVSDCGAVRDIFDGHHYRPTQAQASAISLQRGMDNECVDFFTKVKDDPTTSPTSKPSSRAI